MHMINYASACAAGTLLTFLLSIIPAAYAVTYQHAVVGVYENQAAAEDACNYAAPDYMRCSGNGASNGIECVTSDGGTPGSWYEYKYSAATGSTITYYYFRGCLVGLAICPMGEVFAESGECIAEPGLDIEASIGAARICTYRNEPIDFRLGNVSHIETDTSGNSPSSITINRYYNSAPRVRAGSFGRKWRHSYDREVVVSDAEAEAWRPDGSRIRFLYYNGGWVAAGGYAGAHLQATGSGFELRLPSGVERYDASGLLQSSMDPTGRKHTVSRDTNGRLTRIENELGNYVEFQYGPGGKIAVISDQAARSWNYEYAGGQLTRVVSPDGTFRNYRYTWVSGSAELLVSVEDERGIISSSYDYYDNAAASLASHVNNVDRREFTYNDDGSRIVTDSLGRVSTYNTTKSLGEILPEHITR